MDKYIMEKAVDMSTDKYITPFSYKITNIINHYCSKNIVLENGQLITLDCGDSLITEISDFMFKILIEFIESEKNLNECYEIINQYIEYNNNVNNTYKYSKKLCDIIINMDRVHKYVWCIVKLLNDNADTYDNYEFWKRCIARIENDTLNKWQVIYQIRNELEHPSGFYFTHFKRSIYGIDRPKIVLANNEYDILILAENSLKCIFEIFCKNIEKAFFYSKYTICFTDKKGKLWYRKDCKC